MVAPMASARRGRRARRAIRDRSVPRVLAVTITLALLLGVGGVSYGLYRVANGSDLAAGGPTLGVPLSAASSGTPAGSAAATGTEQTASAADSATPSGTPSESSTAAPSSTKAAVKAQGRTTTVPVSTAPSTPPPASASSTPSASTPSSPAADVAQQVFTLTNVERVAAGCQPLTWNATLAAVAAAHSADMAANNYLDHNSLNGTTPAQRITAAGYTWTITAENIAAGQATPADVMASWMASAGHKANILNCSLTELGVGFASGGSYGTYWTEDFATP